MTLVWRPGFAYDTDASAYIDAVEVADGQALETATRYAINDFVLGCKQDGIWTAIKASCILAGARTKEGAIVPLANASGVAPTLNGTAGGWNYNRKTGLQGNGTNNYINSGRNNNQSSGADQNNQHMSVYASSAATSGAGAFPIYIGSGGGLTGATLIGRDENNGQLYCRNRSSGFDFVGGGGDVGLLAMTRATSPSFTFLRSKTPANYTRASQTPYAFNVFVLATNEGDIPTAVSYANARLAFYSIGESLDLARLDGRLTDLINAFAVAIP